MGSRSLPRACWPLLADPKSGRLMTVRLPASAAGSSTSPRSFKKYVVSPTWRTADGVHSVTLTETRSGRARLTVAERTQGSACRRRARSVWLRGKMLRAEEEDAAVGRQTQRAGDLRNRQVLRPGDLQVPRAKGGLRQQEEECEDLAAEHGDLHDGPDPPSPLRHRRGRRRRGAAAAFLNGAGPYFIRPNFHAGS